MLDDARIRRNTGRRRGICRAYLKLDGSIYSPSAKKDFSVPAYNDDNNILPWAKWGEDNYLPTGECARMH